MNTTCIVFSTVEWWIVSFKRNGQAYSIWTLIWWITQHQVCFFKISIDCSHLTGCFLKSTMRCLNLINQTKLISGNFMYGNTPWNSDLRLTWCSLSFWQLRSSGFLSRTITHLIDRKFMLKDYCCWLRMAQRRKTHNCMQRRENCFWKKLILDGIISVWLASSQQYNSYSQLINFSSGISHTWQKESRLK